MTTLEIFDPPMCCETGICGAFVDPALVKFAADLDWLRTKGVTIERYNLAQQPKAFTENPLVMESLEKEGNGCLPLILVEGKTVSKGVYPLRAQMSSFAGLHLEEAPSMITPAILELVAIGAAIASNCEPCFRFHYDKARKLGVSREDMLSAVETAQVVKDTPARSIRDLAFKYLNQEGQSKIEGKDLLPGNGGSGCC